MKISLGAKPILYPTPAVIVCTYDQNENPNGMAVAWAGICCSRPPSIGISITRKALTYESLLFRKAFTVNIPSEIHAAETDYFGLVSGRDEDKFEKAKLTPIQSDIVDAPYILEFPVVLECKLTQQVEIGLHTQFIGEIMNVLVDQHTLNEDSVVEIERVKPLIFSPVIYSYYTLGEFIGSAFSIGKSIQSDVKKIGK